jgi:hypothetical protein
MKITGASTLIRSGEHVLPLKSSSTPAGGIRGGIPGAMGAVPPAAAIAHAGPELRRRPDPAEAAADTREKQAQAAGLGDEHVPQ